MTTLRELSETLERTGGELTGMWEKSGVALPAVNGGDPADLNQLHTVISQVTEHLRVLGGTCTNLGLALTEHGDDTAAQVPRLTSVGQQFILLGEQIRAARENGRYIRAEYRPYVIARAGGEPAPPNSP